MKRSGSIQKLSFLIALGVMAVVFVVVVFWICMDDRKAEVNAVRQCFARMPNVTVTFISDLEKQASQSISATLEIRGKGKISFAGLSPDSFEHPRGVTLEGIGEFGFRTRERRKGEEGYGYAIDVGPRSPIPAAKRLGITNVQSAVSHYDELLALVSHWPVTTQGWPSFWPPKKGEWDQTSDEEIHFPDLPNGDYFFCLKRLDTPSTDLPPNYPAK